MGFRSTLTINREQAMSAIMKKLHSASNDQLADILLELYEDIPYNYSVSAECCADDARVLRNLFDSNWDE